jgi:glycosyltransferase involved in cell wall biosynthesis
MNILVLNHYQTSLRFSSSSRFATLAQDWVKMGHHVTVVSASYSHIYNTQPPFRGLIQTELVDGIRYVLLKTPSYTGNGWRRALNMVVYCALVLLFIPKLAFAPRADAVIASSVYMADSIPAWLISRLTGGRFIREIRDIWPLSLVELGVLPASSMLVRGLGWLESFSLRRADRVVSTLPFALDHFRTKGLESSRFTYVPQALNPFDPEPGRDGIPGDVLASIEGLRTRATILVGSAGSFGHGSSKENLLEAARLLKGEGVAFVIVGDMTKQQHCIDFIAAEALSNVLLVPKSSRQVCASVLAEMDVLYIGWDARPMYRFGISPNRMLDYMLSGKPIIHAISYGNDPVAEARCGVSVHAEDPLAVVSGIRTLAAMSPDARQRMGAAGTAYVHEHHDPSVLATRYLELMT